MSPLFQGTQPPPSVHPKVGGLGMTRGFGGLGVPSPPSQKGLQSALIPPPGGGAHIFFPLFLFSSRRVSITMVHGKGKLPNGHRKMEDSISDSKQLAKFQAPC